MPIPTNDLVKRARTMGERSRRSRVTRTDAEAAIKGYAYAWSVAHNDPSDVTQDDVDLALQAYARGRRARFSAPTLPALPLRFAPTRNVA